MHLRYGMNPHQHANVFPSEGERWPVRILNGSPSYINLLDALNAWQLVREAGRTLGRPAAASFKHASPAGAAVAGPIDDVITELYSVNGRDVEPVTSAYLRARDADPKSSYGDLAAVSTPVGTELAEILGRVVCDGIIAPGYEPGVVRALSRKQDGRFLVIEADVDFTPPTDEVRDMWGVRLTQQRDREPISSSLLADVTGGRLSSCTADDLLLAWWCSGTPSPTRFATCATAPRSASGPVNNRASTARDWPAPRSTPGGYVGTHVFASSSSAARSVARIGSTPRSTSSTTSETRSGRRGSGHRRELRSRPTDYSRSGTNVDQAARHGVGAIVEPGGASVRSTEVEDACLEHGIVLVRTGLRLFHH